MSDNERPRAAVPVQFTNSDPKKFSWAKAILGEKQSNPDVWHYRALVIDNETDGGIEARVRAAVDREYREWNLGDVWADDVVAGIVAATLRALGIPATEPRQ